MKQLIFLVIALFFISQTVEGQFWNKKIKGNKNVIEITRSVGEYDKVQVLGSWDVILQYGKEGELSLSGEENVLSEITTMVENNTLRISTKKKSNVYPTKKVTIIVPFKDIDAVSLLGSGSIQGKDEIESKDFTTKLSGSGDIHLNINSSETYSSVTGSGDITLVGTTNILVTKVTGSGDFHGKNLSSSEAEATVTGSGDAEISVKNSINAKVTGSGDIVYYGDPTDVKIKTTGSGDISSSK